jgi:hypothetical protein
MNNLYIKLSNFCGFWADRPIKVTIHTEALSSVLSTQSAFKEMVSFLNKAAVERPGSESRIYWTHKAWGAYCRASRWGTMEQD